MFYSSKNFNKKLNSKLGLISDKDGNRNNYLVILIIISDARLFSAVNL